MKLSLGTATCIWLSIIMMVTSSLAIRDAVVQEQRRLGVYETVTFDMEMEEDVTARYKTFIADLRSKFESAEKACGIPITRDELAAKGIEYVLVDLKISSTAWVTLALKVTDLYLVAYRVNKQYKGKYQAIFLNEPDVADAKAKLFKDGTQIVLDYDSNYKSIEPYAYPGKKMNRQKLDLGLGALKSRLEAFYNEAKPVITPAEEAKFFLTAIQMVSEAARYSYIEDKVVTSAEHYIDFKPDDKMIALETSWSKTSKFVVNAQKGGLCESQAVLDIKQDTKLLLLEKTRKLSANVFYDGLWSQIATSVVETGLVDG